MQTDKIIIPGIVETSAMTVFSYMISKSKIKNFRELEVLAQLMHHLPTHVSKRKAQIAGWGMHYAIGVIGWRVMFQPHPNPRPKNL